MKNFLLYIILVLLTGMILLEIVTRKLKLSAHTIPMETENIDMIYKAGKDSTFVRGNLGEIKSHYHINKQGWNSLKDYSFFEEDKIRVAIIGDSYIEGFHSDVEHSIGRILERQMNNTVTVHEFGVAGANIVDYSRIYQKFVKGKYDYVFITLSNIDVLGDSATLVGKKKTNTNSTIARKIYNETHFIRYLNINHNVGKKIDVLFSKGPSSINEIHNEDVDIMAKMNYQALKQIDSTVVYLYEKGHLDDRFISYSSSPVLEIIHTRLPKDHGFDVHWNRNGRKNCADVLEKYILSDKTKKNRD